MSVNSKKFLVPIDLAQNELRKAVIENTATVPSGGTYVTGQLVSVGTTLIDLYVYSGTSGWAKLTRSGAITSSDLAATSGIALTSSTNSFNNTQTITLTSGNNKGLVILANTVSQTANLTEWTNQSGVTGLAVDGSGQVNWGPTSGTQSALVPTTGAAKIVTQTNTVGLKVLANSAQSGVNVTEWQTSTGTVTTAIGATGSLLAYQGLSTTVVRDITSNSVAMTVSANQNIQIGSSTTSYGNGQGVIGITSATVTPNTNPTGGGILYVDAGTLKYLGTSGTATVVAYANGAATGGVTSVNGLTGAITGIATTAGSLAQFGSTTSAQVAALLTDETGTGSVVFSTSPVLANVTLGTVYSANLANATGLPVSTGISGLATGVSGFLGTGTSASLASAITDETGTGSLVFATSPVLANVTLGTVYSANLANATGLPVSTGISGLGTGVANFLATPNSANFAAALTDESGTSSVVFSNSPVLANVTLGTLYSGNLANGTGYTVDNLANLASGMTTFLKTGTSASLASALTDEAGNNAVVFSNGASMTNVSVNTATFTGTVTVPNPVNPTDAANKYYVDQISQGVNAHDPVQVATTAAFVATFTPGSTGADGGNGVGANLTIAAATTFFPIDGYTLSLNDRILVKNQTDQTQNGIYYVSNIGTPSTLSYASTSTPQFGVLLTINTTVAHGLTANVSYVNISNSNNGSGIYDGTYLVYTTPTSTSFQLTGLNGSTGSGFSGGSPVVLTAGSGLKLTRALDYDNSTAGDATPGDLVYVINGSAYTGIQFVETAAGSLTTPKQGIKFGTDNITWGQFSGASATSAGNGLVATGNRFDVVSSTGTLTVGTDTVDLSTVTFSNTVSSVYSVIHGLTVDAYGRVTGIASGAPFIATASAAGIASFPTANFTITGNAISITNVAGSVVSGAVAVATQATSSTNVTVTESTTSATYYPVFSNSASTGAKGLLQNSGTNAMSFNPSTGTLATTAGGLGYSPTLTANTAFYVNSAGNGITNGTLPITAGGTGATTANTARTALAATGKYTANNIALTMTSNSVSWSVPAATHLLGTTGGLIVTMKDNSTNSVVEPDIQIAETGDVTINWATSANVAANAYRVTIIG